MKSSIRRTLVDRARAHPLVAAGAAAALCLALVPAAGQAAAPAAPKPAAARSSEQLGNYDSRVDGTSSKALETREARLNARPGAGVRALRASLGSQGVVDLDPVTATPRIVARLDGFLTGPSQRRPAAIAKSYLRTHPGVFKLSAAEVGAMRVRKDYVDIRGTHHLSLVQSVEGVAVFGNGVKAHVDRRGRLIQVDGSPVASLPAHLAPPRLGAASARATAVKGVFGETTRATARTGPDAARTTTFSNGDQAKLVLFKTLGGVRTSWQVVDMRNGWLSVVDAATGRVVYRQNLVASDNARVWGNYPGAARGGTQKNRNLATNGWLPYHSTTLNGNVAHVFKDVNDDDVAGATEEVPNTGRRAFNYPFTPFAGAACPTGWTCSWDPDTPNSWQTNANQTAVQLFYFLGRMHDHLASRPIGFTRAAGNFEAVDGDAVDGNAIDGADTGGGVPDANHVDNANMSTPPDGIPPRMQMYLFHLSGTAFPDEDPFLAGNSGDEADVVYHEYTHGLSNRLVVDANGVSTLGNIQAGSMGEAWSDWYAMDFLVNNGYFTDRRRQDGDLRMGEYVGWGNDLIRYQPVDCAVGSTSASCQGTPGAGPGGFTYGDFGLVDGAPEVHSDGEIWVQTLWDLRRSLGVRLTENLVTRAMELSPANPSYLDERNAILVADMVVNGGRDQKAIWTVFAHRGMGWFAASTSGDDTGPAEDFSMPPPPGTPTGSLTGVVTDSISGAPVEGAVVAFGGHASGFGGSYAATTDATGHYTISGILPGTYAKVFAQAPGFEPDVRTLSVRSAAQTVDWEIQRDWASLTGGASVVDFNGVDYTPFGCGPSVLFDQSQGSGWSTDAVLSNPADQADVDPRWVVLELPQAVDVADIQINPSGTCGDGLSASTGKYSVETSPDGTTWQLVSTPGAAFGGANRSRMNSIDLNPGAVSDVRFVRYTMLGTQLHVSGGACPGAFSACDFVDSVELALYGTPSP